MDQTAGDQIGFQAQVAGEEDADRSFLILVRLPARQQHGVHEHAVLLEAHVARVHPETDQVLPGVRVREPHVQHPRQRHPALVDQGTTGFDVQVVEVFQEEGGRRPAEDRCGL